jgi:hypothetical protein
MYDPAQESVIPGTILHNHIKGGIKLSGKYVWSSSTTMGGKLVIWSFIFINNGSRRPTTHPDLNLFFRALCVRRSGD